METVSDDCPAEKVDSGTSAFIALYIGDDRQAEEHSTQPARWQELT